MCMCMCGSLFRSCRCCSSSCCCCMSISKRIYEAFMIILHIYFFDKKFCFRAVNRKRAQNKIKDNRQSSSLFLYFFYNRTSYHFQRIINTHIQVHLNKQYDLFFCCLFFFFFCSYYSKIAIISIISLFSSSSPSSSLICHYIYSSFNYLYIFARCILCVVYVPFLFVVQLNKLDNQTEKIVESLFFRTLHY